MGVIWALLVNNFPFICDSLRQNFDMMTIVGTMAEIAFSISNNQRKPNNAMSSTANNMQHKVSASGPIIHDMRREIENQM